MGFNKQFKINDTMIGENCPPYIIAEMSANHGGNIDKAKEIIRTAHALGANAIKLQTYRADTITLDCKKEEFFIHEGPWKGQYLYDLYEYAYTPWEWTQELVDLAKDLGITLFSSPFDISSIEFLEQFNMPAYKVASSELIDIPLLRRIAKTGKPIIISTGFSTLAEISQACEVLHQEGVQDVCILKCTAEYPAPVEDINLATINHMKECFGTTVGFSDHTLGTSVPLAAIALGATVIEKHFILSRDDNSADSFFSATPEELKALVEGAKNIHKAIGKILYPIEAPKPKRSIMAVSNIKKGEAFYEGKNIKSLRPGGGITPENLDLICTKKASCDIEYGTLLQWEHIS